MILIYFLGIDFIHWLAENNRNFHDITQNIFVELGQYMGKTDYFEQAYLWKMVDKIDSRTWWSGYCSKTSLKNIALAILTLPPSSAATERTFSKYSFLHTKKRNRLTTERAGKLAFVAANINLESKLKTIINTSNSNNSSNLTEPKTKKIRLDGPSAGEIEVIEHSSESEAEVEVSELHCINETMSNLEDSLEDVKTSDGEDEF